MRKKLTTIGILIVLAVLLTACNSSKDAFLDYNNEFIMKDYILEEEEYLSLNREYQEVVNESDNDLVIRLAFMTEEVLPKSQQLLDLVKGYKLENEEVQKMHNLLVESEELRHQAIELELESIKMDSEKLFYEGVDLMEKSDGKKLEFIDKRDELAKIYNLEKVDD